MRYIVLMLLLCCVSVAQAVDQIRIDLSTGAGSEETITVGAGMKAAITRLTAAENAQRAAQAPPQPPLTAEQFLRQHIVNTVQSRVEAFRALDKQDACTRFAALTPAQQATVLARPEWNGANPCAQ